MLSRRFYQRDTVTVAKSLLGKRLVRVIGNDILSGIITETEAYGHTNDSVSHAFRGMTERNKVMFGTVGISYVYFTYGMHFCFNVVARNRDSNAGAVLIRSIKPEQGIEIMMNSRGTRDQTNLTNGPAKLAKALSITKSQYGVDLTSDSTLYITHGKTRKKITAGQRIGVREKTPKMWNFSI